MGSHMTTQIKPDSSGSHPDVPVIIMTAYHDLETTVSAMQGGAVDYVPKPINVAEMDTALEQALNHQDGCASEGDGDSDNTLILKPDDGSTVIVGHSPAMQNVFKQIALVSQSRATVLIEGESGTCLLYTSDAADE